MRQSFLVSHIPRSAHPHFQSPLPLLTLGSIHYFYSILAVTILLFLLKSLVHYPLVNVHLHLFLFLPLFQTLLHHTSRSTNTHTPTSNTISLPTGLIDLSSHSPAPIIMPTASLRQPYTSMHAYTFNTPYSCYICYAYSLNTNPYT
jgi:hypothetical protein